MEGAENMNASRVSRVADIKREFRVWPIRKLANGQFQLYAKRTRTEKTGGSREEIANI